MIVFILFLMYLIIFKKKNEEKMEMEVNNIEDIQNKEKKKYFIGPNSLLYRRDFMEIKEPIENSLSFFLKKKNILSFFII